MEEQIRIYRAEVREDLTKQEYFMLSNVDKLILKKLSSLEVAINENRA